MGDKIETNKKDVADLLTPDKLAEIQEAIDREAAITENHLLDLALSTPDEERTDKMRAAIL